MSKTVYEIVTEKVLEMMDKGVVAWRKPWDANGLRPCNAESMRPYSGGNMFLLSMKRMAIAIRCPRNCFSARTMCMNWVVVLSCE